MHKLTAAIVAALLMTTPASAALIEFSASATFSTFSGPMRHFPLTGTLTIDTATGLFSHANLTFTSQYYPDIIAQGNHDTGAGIVYLLDVQSTRWNGMWSWRRHAPRLLRFCTPDPIEVAG